MKKIVRLTESDLVRVINRVINEQLIKSTDKKIDAASNKEWVSLKSKLIPMGFKVTYSKEDYPASPNPLNLIYLKVGKREILTMKKNGYEVSVQWPGGAIDTGIVEPTEALIEIEQDGGKPNFKALANQVKSLAQTGPGLGLSLIHI